MRHQMGNNNVSGLQEEEKSSAVEVQEKITQEAVHGDDVKVEDDDKDLHEKIEESALNDYHSGTNDSLIQSEISDGKEEDDNEKVDSKDLVVQAAEIDNTEEGREDLVVQTTDTKSEHVVQLSEVPTESSGEAIQGNESQTAPLSKLSSDSEELQDLNLEKHAFEASNPEILQQQSVGRETEEVDGSNSVSDANCISGNVLDRKSNDQDELVDSQDEPCGEDLVVVEKASELLESNLSNPHQDKIHTIDDRTAEHFDVKFISDTSKQDMEKKINDPLVEGNISEEGYFLETIRISEENLEQLWVHEDEKGSSTGETEPVFSSDPRDKGEKMVDTSEEVSVPQDKSIVLTEESRGAERESENEEGISGGERNAKENTSDSNSSPEMENASQIEDHKIENGDIPADSNADKPSKKIEGLMENEPVQPEVRKGLATLTVIELNQKQENSTEGGLVRISDETTEETAINQVEHRRSPSFDFDLSLVESYEDSDKTPLLCHDKAASRSMSSRDVLTFQTNTSKNEYGRKQTVEVEEKTIKMERSDSDKPRAPFMTLLKKEGNVNAFVELKQEEAPLTEQALVNSTRGSGKRRQRASLFTTCICCATSITRHV